MEQHAYGRLLVRMNLICLIGKLWPVVGLHLELILSRHRLPTTKILLCHRAPLIVFSCSHERVLRRVCLINACVDWSQRRAPIEPPEERCRVPFVSPIIDDPMDGTHEEVVGHSHEAIRNIYDERTRDRLHSNPVSRLAKDLEAFRVLCDDGEVLHVRVSTDAVLIVSRSRLCWIMKDSHTRLRNFDVLVKCILWQV